MNTFYGPAPASTLFPAPPPTQNALSSTNRAALLRSTRKLGAVLGSTPFLLDAFGPASPSAPGTVKTPLRVLPIGPLRNDPVKMDAERKAHRRQRRQGSIFEVPPMLGLPAEKPTLKVSTSKLAVPLWTSPSPSPSSATSPLTALININLALASSSESEESDCTPISPVRTRGRSFGDRVRQRTSSRSRSRRAARKQRPPPLVLTLDIPTLTASEEVSYFSPDTAAAPMDCSRFSPDTPAPPMPLPFEVPPVSTMPTMDDGMEDIPLTPPPTNANGNAAARKKMAKLARTLGEPVPVELVFPTAASRSPSPRKMMGVPLRNLYSPYQGRKSSSRSRSPVRERVPFNPPGLGVNVSVSVTQSVSSPGPTVPTTRRRHVPPPIPISPVRDLPPRSPAPFASVRRRYRTLNSVLREDMSSRLRESTPAQRPVVRSSRDEERKGEEGVVSWIGEWNREDMEVVRKGLRALPRA